MKEKEEEEEREGGKREKDGSPLCVAITFILKQVHEEEPELIGALFTITRLSISKRKKERKNTTDEEKRKR